MSVDPQTVQVGADVADVFASLDAATTAQMLARRGGTLVLADTGPFTDAELTAVLTDPSEKVRGTLARNRWCPTWALERLAADPHRSVARPARLAIVTRRGVLPAEYADRSRIEEVIELVRATRLPGGVHGLARALRDTWGFTVADVTALVDAAADMDQVELVADELAANLSLDDAALAVVCERVTIPPTRWANHPGVSAQRIRSIVDDLGTDSRTALWFAGHRNCPPDVACAIVDAHRRDAIEVVDLSHPEVAAHAAVVLRSVVESHSGWVACSSYLEALRENPTAGEDLVGIVGRAVLAMAGPQRTRDVLSDPRLPLDLVASTSVSGPREVRLLCLARLCSGRPHAGDVLAAAFAIAANSTDLSFDDVIEVAESVVA